MADKTLNNDVQKLRAMTVADLRQRLSEAKQEMFAMRVKAVTKEQTDTSAVRKKRREIARINTVITEKSRVAAN